MDGMRTTITAAISFFGGGGFGAEGLGEGTGGRKTLEGSVT